MNRWLVFFLVMSGSVGYPKRKAVVIDFTLTPGSGPFGAETKIAEAIYEFCKIEEGVVSLTGMVKMEGELTDVILNDQDVTANIGTFKLDTMA